MAKNKREQLLEIMLSKLQELLELEGIPSATTLELLVPDGRPIGNSKIYKTIINQDYALSKEEEVTISHFVELEVHNPEKESLLVFFDIPEIRPDTKNTIMVFDLLLDGQPYSSLTRLLGMKDEIYSVNVNFAVVGPLPKESRIDLQMRMTARGGGVTINNTGTSLSGNGPVLPGEILVLHKRDEFGVESVVQP